MTHAARLVTKSFVTFLAWKSDARHYRQVWAITTLKAMVLTSDFRYDNFWLHAQGLKFCNLVVDPLKPSYLHWRHHNSSSSSSNDSCSISCVYSYCCWPHTTSIDLSLSHQVGIRHHQHPWWMPNNLFCHSLHWHHRPMVLAFPVSCLIHHPHCMDEFSLFYQGPLSSMTFRDFLTKGVPLVYAPVSLSSFRQQTSTIG